MCEMGEHCHINYEPSQDIPDQSHPPHHDRPLCSTPTNADMPAIAIVDELDHNASLSHELRTSLTSIQAALELVRSGYLGTLPERMQHLLDIAVENTSRLVRLANAIEGQTVPLMTVLSASAIAQLQLENDLCLAWENQNFQLVYQPIFSLEQNTIVGFEALARWQHPDRGWVSPSVFIPLSEKTGLIHPLGLWILEQACHQLHHWQHQFPTYSSLHISVNLSTLQLLQPELVQYVQKILQKTGVAPEHLKLEITESALIENHEVAIAVISNLRDLGIQFYIDDFGTGYSSFGRLADLPIHTLKIDRSFIEGKKWDITEALILLASKLGLEVIAEGVETMEELESLRHLGCKQIQGHFFSRPIDHHSVATLLQNTLIINQR